MEKKFEINIPLILAIIIFFTGYGIYNHFQSSKIDFASPDELAIECAYNTLDALYNNSDKAYGRVVDYCYNMEEYIVYGINKSDIVNGLKYFYQDYLKGDKYPHEIKREFIKIDKKSRNKGEGLEYLVTYKYKDIDFKTRFHLNYNETRWYLIY